MARILRCHGMSERLAIFFIRAGIFKDAKVRRVAARCYEVVVYRLTYSASWFVCVAAVVVSALMRQLEYFREVVRHFVLVHVNSAEAFNSRGIYYSACIARQLEHFGECSCVHAGVVNRADGCGP